MLAGQAARLIPTGPSTQFELRRFGHDRSIVRMTGIRDFMNPIRPWTRFDVNKAQYLLSQGRLSIAKINDAANTTDDRNFKRHGCQKILDIPNDVFEAITDITVEACQSLPVLNGSHSPKVRLNPPSHAVCRSSGGNRLAPIDVGFARSSHRGLIVKLNLQTGHIVTAAHIIGTTRLISLKGSYCSGGFCG